MNLDVNKLARRVNRARSAVGVGVRYKLGRGGFHPAAPAPDCDRVGSVWVRRFEADCSGFVAWCLVMRRDQINAGKWWSRLLPWIETTMVHRDATGPQRVFVTIHEPVPGCLVVYGDVGRSQGHIGIVSQVYEGTGKIKVIDCSAGQFRATGDAIREHSGDFFLRHPGTVFCVLREDVLG
jgi:hypothetical protein